MTKNRTFSVYAIIILGVGISLGSLISGEFVKLVPGFDPLAFGIIIFLLTLTLYIIKRKRLTLFESKVNELDAI